MKRKSTAWGFHYCYLSQEAQLRNVTKHWRSVDFLAAIDRLVTCRHHMADIAAIRELYRTMRTEREVEESRGHLETLAAHRHSEITKRLDELKVPHWSVIPNFCVTVVGAVAAVVAAIAAWVALHK